MKNRILFLVIGMLATFSFSDEYMGQVLSVRSEILDKSWSCDANANNTLNLIKIKKDVDGSVVTLWVKKSEKDAIAIALTAYSTGAKVWYEPGQQGTGGCSSFYMLGRLYLADAQ